MAKEDKSAKDSLTFITPTGTATFVHIWEPFAFKSKDPAKQKEPQYRLTLVFDDEADLSEMKKIAGQALVKKFGKAEASAMLKRKQLSLPWRDGIEYEEYGEPFTNDGAVFISASSRSAPGVVNERAKQIMKQQDFYPGCLARISVYAHAFDSMGNKGVTFLLNNVQKMGDGTKLAGARKNAEDEFDAVEGSGKGGDDDLDDILG